MTNEQSHISGEIDATVTTKVAKAYFDALVAHDIDAAVACWRPGGRENVRGQVDTTAPDGVREFLGGIFEPFPDFHFNVVEVTVEDDRAAVRWEATGTFTGGGHVGKLALSIAGTGDADLARLQADQADVSVAGTGNGTLASNGKVTGSVVGTGEITVHGKAQCDVSVPGTGKVNCQP